MTAIKTTGLGDNWYVGGNNLSADTSAIGSVHGGNTPIPDMQDITMGAQARAGGVRDGGMDWVSFFDKQTGQAHLTLSALPRTDTLVSYFHQPAVGGSCAHMVAKQIGYDPTRDAAGRLTVGVAAMANAYGLEWGQQLTAGVRTDTTGTSGASVDLGAVSTLFGLQAYLHVFSVTGTSVTVTLEDSANNSAFTAVTSGAFVAATGAGWQRIATLNTATIRRYVRVTTSGTFTNAQFAVGFVRNETAGQVF